MPLYEYTCFTCKHEFEKIMGVKQLPPQCPECGNNVERKMSLTSFKLKGDGWASDAYKGSKPNGSGAVYGGGKGGSDGTP